MPSSVWEILGRGLKSVSMCGMGIPVGVCDMRLPIDALVGE